ncbi:hypothetical protein BDV28DRAFT_41869 [Aspergillus coremiiformis]|uniref:Allergen Asp f 4 n=1 Tax=Aspergillus coremiiformis TaxID=138285 RepID=A0A5N6ZI35_9EURO|nr:hypothetical protein BDV28DRAFT_41869 [Aspergillus coremiiformis]
MQWKSFLWFVTMAESGLARLHGHQRRYTQHPAYAGLDGPKGHLNARDRNFGVAADLDVKTIVPVDVVTITTTLTGPAPTSTSNTTVAAPAEPTGLATRKPVISIGLSASFDVPVDATSSTATGWTSTPSGEFSTSGFGKRTESSGSGVKYRGNVGNPWGSNIIEVSSRNASQYKYVVQFTGSNTANWTVVIWNKVGPDGKLDGWYGNSAVNFTLGAGEMKYVAFDENSQGAWGASQGSSLPTDDHGGYSCTWGEFDFGNTSNKGWSGWDVSAIQAQVAGQTVQGMKICNHNGEICSIITSDASTVANAYTKSEASVDGIGGALNSGPVRLATVLDYRG